MMTVLVTGANGQLGHAIKSVSPGYPSLKLIFCNRDDLNLMDDSSIRSAMEMCRPDIVINAGAYTAVDAAESDREKALQINGTAVGVLAEACEELGANLIQISTDYIFGGNQNKPYSTDFTPRPINYYGVTKLEGEKLAVKNCRQTLIVRTAWLHSDFGTNFANTMRRFFQEREEVRVVDDQIGRPTHAEDLARFCLDSALVEPFPKGVKHFGGSEIMSWYEFAQQLLSDESFPVTKRIIPVPSSEHPTRAVRPKYSVLDLS